MVNAYDLLGLVPTYLLPPVQHWAREAEANARARKLPLSHPDRAPRAIDNTPDAPPSVDKGKGKGKASSHARIDSVASDASATTVASTSSSVSRSSTASSASSASVEEGERLFANYSLLGNDLIDEPLLTEPSDSDAVAAAHRPALATPSHVNDTGSQRRLRRILPSTIRCRRCSADFAFTTQIISKGFTARNGRGYLVSPPPTNVDHTLCAEYDSAPDDVRSDEDTFVWATRQRYDQRSRAKRDEYHRRRRCNNLPNIAVGSCQYRSLTTGQHVIAEIVCCGCNAEVGWKYIDAREANQKYKVGSFILEVNKIAVFRGWEDVDAATVDAIEPLSTSGARADEDADDQDPLQPHPSFWAVRSRRALGLADANPLAAARAMTALRHHANATSPRPRPPPTVADTDADPYPDPGFDAYESDVVDTIRYRMQHHEDPMLDRLHQRRLAKLEKARSAQASERQSAAQALRARERRTEIPPPEIAFDSQDEDECDELFSGTWDARIVAARRAERARHASPSRFCVGQNRVAVWLGSVFMCVTYAVAMKTIAWLRPSNPRLAASLESLLVIETSTYALDCQIMPR